MIDKLLGEARELSNEALTEEVSEKHKRLAELVLGIDRAMQRQSMLPEEWARPVILPDGLGEREKRAFIALTSGEYDNFALMQCSVDGESASVIVSLTDDGDGNAIVRPMFVSVTERMRLLDPSGNPTVPQGVGDA